MLIVVTSILEDMHQIKLQNCVDCKCTLLASYSIFFTIGRGAPEFRLEIKKSTELSRKEIKCKRFSKNEIVKLFQKKKMPIYFFKGFNLKCIFWENDLLFPSLLYVYQKKQKMLKEGCQENLQKLKVHYVDIYIF
jgi:hypothetical protein